LNVNDCLAANQRRVNARRLHDDLTSLAQIGRRPGGGISRTAYSAADATARQWYADRCSRAGLTLRLDGLGNMFALAAGADQAVPAVWTGSHLDTVPNGGGFDGALGSVAALECLRRITELNLQLRRPVCAAVFSDEEGNYSGRLLGSYGLAHGYSHADLTAMRGRDGDALLDALASWDWSAGSPTETRLPRGAMHSYVELHIEQGPHLEASGADIGVVTSIVGLCGGIAEFTGQADHAGTTPMSHRRDAIAAAAEFLVRLPPLAAAVGDTAVITCGHIQVEPGAANVIPELASVSLDFRDPARDKLELLRDRIEVEARSAADAHGVGLRWHLHPLIGPVPLASSIQAIIAESAGRLGLGHRAIASGAGHDAQNMALLAPAGMIFVPSRNGRSHCPEEYTDPEATERGANTLLATLVQLAES
jgi:hydantoinase/carbamoylase family amidase